mmetsp:Transcript_25914/g.30103  ORF Transcript_25914/g.30103 Transcript_25914/m.30103 type:complete len:1534 (+) Transcript_25914:234-4835(+)
MDSKRKQSPSSYVPRTPSSSTTKTTLTQNSSQIELTTSKFQSFGTCDEQQQQQQQQPSSSPQQQQNIHPTRNETRNRKSNYNSGNSNRSNKTNKRKKKKKNTYKGWKLTIPAPTYYKNQMDDYDSYCIELYGGHTATSATTATATTKSDHELIIAPFIQIPNKIIPLNENDTNHNEAAAATATATTGSATSTKCIIKGVMDDLFTDDPRIRSTTISATTLKTKSAPVSVSSNSVREVKSPEYLSLLSSLSYKNDSSSSTQNLSTRSSSSRLSSPSPSPSLSSSSSSAWTYKAPTLTNWNISSHTLLSITYQKSIHVIPENTNQNFIYDYTNRIYNKLTKSIICCRSSSTSKNNITNSTGGNGNTDNIHHPEKQTKLPCQKHQKEVYQEKYTEQDIQQIKTFDIQITGFTGVCTAIQVHFRSKHHTSFVSASESGGGSPSAAAAASTYVKSTQQKQHQYRFNYNTDSHSKSSYATTEHELNNHLNQHIYKSHDYPSEQHNDTSTKPTTSPTPLSSSSSSTLHSESNKLPFHGNDILQASGYGVNNDYGLPLPPWHPNSKQEEDGEKSYLSSSSYQFGPIVTFAIPNVSDKEQMKPSSTSSSSTNNNLENHNVIMQDAAPLLWKVDIPPDPTIALEAITVLDGILDVYPEEVDDEEEEEVKYHNHKSKNNNGNDNIMEEDDDSCSSSNSSSSEYDDEECDACHPHNIYINGYQSWSYAGSVKKGEEQPTTAMPDFLSRAFNYGGDVPPVATVKNVFDVDAQDKNATTRAGATIANGSYVPVVKRRKKIDTPKKKTMYDVDDLSFHDATFYKSDFFTCVSTSEIEDLRAQSNAAGIKACASQADEGQFNNRAKTKLDEMGGTVLVLGFLSQRKQFGVITFDSELRRVAMHASLQGVVASRSTGISTDWAYCQILPSHVYDEEPMFYYLNAVSAYNNAKPMEQHPPLTGWCSWYHYYENIDLVTLNDNFEKMSRLKKMITQDLAIVDDGYITAWGDWDSLKAKEFPKESGGMKALADSIRRNDMMPGLWMAPFACDKHSKIAKEHPDWIIRNDRGRIANSSNCGKFFYGLDATNPAVREFAFTSVRRAVEEWGYDCLKLDFLYAACLEGNGKYDLSMSRAETMYLALQTVRAAAGPNTFLIGCGCPIGPAIGYVDGMRVSADTGPSWYPDFPLPWWDNGTLPSLRAMIRNSTTRAALGHRWWHNDPDCVLLGDTTNLTDNEVVSAASVVAMTGGMLLLSDDLSKLSNERLRVASRIFPVTGITAVVLDLHNTSISGIPSLLRLWCTDSIESNSDTRGDGLRMSAVDLASRNSRRASFSPNQPWKSPLSRERNCVPVAKGLGTWSVVSLSNWLDEGYIMSVPIVSLLPPSRGIDTVEATGSELNLGYHVFAFWSSKYIWVSSHKLDGQKTISKRLGPRETEIFHVKPVQAHFPQYIGSELHFTCGYEVQSMSVTERSIKLQFKNDSKRSGFVYLYVPTFDNKIHMTINGKATRAEVVTRTPQFSQSYAIYGGQVIRVFVVIVGSNSSSGNDGSLTCRY